MPMLHGLGMTEFEQTTVTQSLLGVSFLPTIGDGDIFVHLAPSSLDNKSVIVIVIQSFTIKN